MNGSCPNGASDHYDVLVTYNSADLEEVREIVAFLKKKSIQSWFDKDLYGGTVWMHHFSSAAQKVACALVILGPKGAGRWQELEIQVLLHYSVAPRSLPLITVLLPGVSGIPSNLDFPTVGRVAIRFHTSVQEKAPQQSLVNAITVAIREPQRKHAFEIEIDVPKAERSCFLAMQRKGLDGVYNAVKQAIQELNGTTGEAVALKQTRDKKDPHTLTDDVVHTIRQSEMVLAVCVPHNGDSGCTPEVMYELGMAQALGKPTVLVTSGTDTRTCIPRLLWDSKQNMTRPGEASSSFWGDYALPRTEFVEYKPNGMPANGLAGRLQGVIARIVKRSRSSYGTQTNGLAGELQDAITRIVQRTPDPYLVDPEMTEIHAIRSDLTRMRSVLWPHFHKVLSFGLKTHHEIRDLMKQSHGLLTHAQKLLEIMVKDSVLGHRGDSFAVHRKAFEDHYRNLLDLDAQWEKDYFNQQPVLGGSLATTFKFLSRHLPKDLQEKVECSERGFKQVLGDVKDYCEYLDSIAKEAKDGFACFDRSKSARALTHKVDDLDDSLGRIYKDAHDMMRKLLEIIVEDGTNDHRRTSTIGHQSTTRAGGYQG